MNNPTEDKTILSLMNQVKKLDLLFDAFAAKQKLKGFANMSGGNDKPHPQAEKVTYHRGNFNAIDPNNIY